MQKFTKMINSQSYFLTFYVDTLIFQHMDCPFFSALRSFPDNIAWSDGKEVFTYTAAHIEITKNQNRFKKLGINSNQSIAIMSENSPRCLALLFAAHREKIPVVVLGQFSSEEAKIDAIKRSYAREIRLDEFYDIEPQDSEMRDHTVSLSTDAVILFTSGSTGIEKGVVLSLENMYSSAEASNACTHLNQNSTWLSSLTISRIGGLAIAYRAAICGAHMSFSEELSVKELEKIIRSSKITHISLVPVQLQELLKNQESISHLKKMTCILLGGAAASESLLRQIEEHNIPVLTTYGMTETSSHISLARLDDPITRVYSSGKILSHTKVRFRSEKNEVSDLKNHTGLLEVSGKTVCKRYIDNIGMEKFTADGWYNTGDIAFLDEHAQLHIIGRSDSMIISGGENIHLREIEIVAERIPGVIAAAAIGVAHEKWGQRPLLFVEAPTLTAPMIKDQLKNKLSKIKVPDDVIILKELPRISIGKIDYQRLKTQY